jgi:predicted acylesterase/phospholipase RssA
MLPISFAPSFFAFVVCSYVSVYATTGLEEPAEADRRKVTAQTAKVRDMFRVQPEAPINVLSIDGGGVRGVIPATVLQMVEERTHKTVRELFDLVVGTSTGGILSLGLMMDDPKTSMEGRLHYRTAEDMRNIYTSIASSIFPPRSTLRKIFEFIPSLFYRSLYSPRPFQESLLRNFEDRTLGDTILPTVVTTVEVGYNKLKLLRSYRDRGVLVREAAYATGAAPGYFPAGCIDGVAVCDGGVSANNPAYIALTEAYNLFPGREVNLVSLGTGQSVGKVTTSDVLRIRLAKSIVHTLFASQADGVHEALLNLSAGLRPLLSLGHGPRPFTYRRVQVDLDNDLTAMDNSSNCVALWDITRRSNDVLHHVGDVSEMLTRGRFFG